MAERIFISYRRDDSAGHAGRAFDRLKTDFGQDVLFMDVDAIPLGANFVRVLRDEVAKCSTLLAIIGPNWLDARDEDGARRLDNPNDFVRVEIAAALQRDIPVIPILLEGARIPKAQTLPDDLKELSERNGLDVRHASFHADMDKLVKGLRRSKAQPSAKTAPAKLVAPSSPPAPRLPAVLPINEVIAAKGRWVSDFKINPNAAVAPDVFGHLFMLVHNVRSDRLAVGAILKGQQWDRSVTPFWDVVHGYCNKRGWGCESISWLTYLGPAWQPEYAQLSEAVFKKLDGKPLERFIKHP